MKRVPRTVRLSTTLAKALPRREFLKGLASLGILTFALKSNSACSPAEQNPAESSSTTPPLSTSLIGEIALPEPKTAGKVSVEEALSKRRSIRSYSGRSLSVAEVSQLVWAAQGVTNSKGYRTAPSAMASFPLRTYVIIGDVDGLDNGVYLYRPAGHALFQMLEGDFRSDLAAVNAGTYYVSGGAIYFLFTTTIGAASDLEKWAHMEVGHAAQNVYLQATSLGMGTVVNGGFNAGRSAQLLQIPSNERLLYFMPIGKLS